MLFFNLLVLLVLDNSILSGHTLVAENSLIEERVVSVFEAKVYSDPSPLALNTDVDIATYEAAKADIDELRYLLKERFSEGSMALDDIKTVFTNYLVDRIIPYWYGTPWSFEGHTASPNQGEIACGYFISTTLRDMGLKLNRYKLAQKSPVDEARVLSCGSAIQSVVQESPEKAFEEIDRLTKEGLYFIGFDAGHVGYLLKRKGQLLLIHSNYLVPRSVCIEPFEASRVFQSFSKFYLVNISNNDTLIQHWLNN